MVKSPCVCLNMACHWEQNSSEFQPILVAHDDKVTLRTPFHKERHTTHATSWFEIPVVDFTCAKSFYEKSLGITIEPMTMGSTTTGMSSTDPNAVGGTIVHGNDGTPSKTGAMVYLNGGDDRARLLSRVASAAGSSQALMRWMLRMPRLRVLVPAGFICAHACLVAVGNLLPESVASFTAVTVCGPLWLSSATGFPVFAHSESGGWSEPGVLGWLLAEAIWSTLWWMLVAAVSRVRMRCWAPDKASVSRQEIQR